MKLASIFFTASESILMVYRKCTYFFARFYYLCKIYFKSIIIFVKIR